MLSLVSATFGETKLDVEVGWGWQPRGERWTPVFVTASDDKTRNVSLAIEWPEGGSYSMRIQQAMTIGPDRRTFPILLPIHGWEYQQAMFTLVDRDSGKSLAHFPKDGNQALLSSGVYQPGSEFVGVSGETSTLGSLQQAVGAINVGYLSPRRLPSVALGFDSLNVLVLNEPNLRLGGFGAAPLDNTQQQAIVDWVAAGGTVILWPGDGGLPETGPLGEKLPAKVGGREDIALSPADLSALGVSSRFKNLVNFRLDPKPAARKIPLLNSGQTSAYAIRLGLGRIILSPVNVAGFIVDDTEHCKNLWRPLMKGIIAFPGDPVSAVDGDDQGDPAAMRRTSTAAFNVYNNGFNADETREKRAAMQAADYLGNVPGAGQIGFSYIAFVLLGLMLVVGPVDWFVLKKLGRQPWTWITTSGWVALVTTGAIFAGYLFKSGDLHYKTLRTIDQAGDYCVASTDYVALYSSRTRMYEINTDGDGWWQPAGLSEYGRTPLKLDMDFHQTRSGNTPEEMLVNVWSLRFLRGDHVEIQPPILSARLKILPPASGMGNASVVGTIANFSDRPLKNVRVETSRGLAELTLTESAAGAALLKEIAPHAAATATGVLLPQQPDVEQLNRYSYYSQPPLVKKDDLWKTAAMLNVRRGRQMADQVASGKFAIIYAETDNPTPAATLANQHAVEEHWQFIRALVELNAGEGK
ncbi:MAG TPA: hypothetical protein VFE47_13080 [Tepidisphaeraceae bacterium]|jgi:hypothetical protein|nr:hypothetical protein [Tepidisphaeraceae bacterium]